MDISVTIICLNAQFNAINVETTWSRWIAPSAYRAAALRASEPKNPLMCLLCSPVGTNTRFAAEEPHSPLSQ